MLTVVRPRGSVNRSAGLVLLACALAWAAPDAQPIQPPLGTRSPRLERLFTPPAAPAGLYEVYERNVPIEELAAAFRRLDVRPRTGAWEPKRLGAGDAFGAEGAYDRARLALLLGGGRITTVRGSLHSPDGSVTAYTLLSPYPDAALTRLQTGTMTIVFHVPRQDR